MFGYIVINKPEMKFKEFDIYQSYYCGLCRVLKEKYGLPGQLSLTYDMTFLIMLLTGLYEPDNHQSSCKCIAHPFEKHTCRTNLYTEYAAAMNLLFTYYKCEDDWLDERKTTRMLYGKTLKSSVRKITEQYPEKASLIQEKLREIHVLEEKKEPNIDLAGGLFGEIMAEFFVYKHDEWEDELRRMGFYFGKFIYLMDAYEDIEKDLKSGNYNPFLALYKENDFDKRCYHILTMMMAECCKGFEKLPILQDVEILRNILYSGVWTSYYRITQKRNNPTKKEEGKSNYHTTK